MSAAYKTLSEMLDETIIDWPCRGCGIARRLSALDPPDLCDYCATRERLGLKLRRITSPRKG